MSRLNDLQEENDRIGREMKNEAGRFNRLADSPSPRIVTAFNLFQTPQHIAAQMAELIPINAQRILEPSAGLGRLYLAGAAARPGSDWVLMDNSPDCCGELYELAQMATIKQGDFLERDDLGLFDCVVMNPPFKQGRDIKHIKHALKMLAPGGLLVALCYAGPRQHRELVPLADHWEQLPPRSFEGTVADVLLLVITG